MPQDFDLSQFKATYFEECHDLLSQAEEHLGDLQTQLDEVDVETLHAIFRCVHSIKGGAGAFNFTDLVSFSHIFETTLDRLREGKLDLTEDLAECLIIANDILAKLVQMAQDDEEVDASIWQHVANDLTAFTDGRKPSSNNKSNDHVATKTVTPKNIDYNKSDAEEAEQGWGLFVDNIEDVTSSDNEEEQGWGLFSDDDVEDDPAANEDIKGSQFKITFLPEAHLLQFANEPLLLIRELQSLGHLNVIVNYDKIPSLSEITADISYLSWEFELITQKSEEKIHEVFEFVIDDCKLEVEKQAGSAFITEKKKTFNPTSEKQVEVQEKDQVRQTSASASPSIQTPLNAPVVNRNPDTKQQKASQDKQQANQTTQAGQASSKVSSIRVDLDRVDKLINIVGELVITQAMLKQQAEDLADNVGHIMLHGFQELSAHTRELQESVMAIRMQPVKSVFARMPRLVRELSTKLNKKIDLITSGEMTEVDKTVIEQLTDPLTHMIRNSVDHGIEGSEERQSVGKSERATILLSAEHRSGRIQIEVSDDGRGINRNRVLEKAIEKGIVNPNEELSDEEIDNLIFSPGFSTAETVSDVSGRGVGMDVVRRNIVNLGGRISVYSTPGEGTRFNLSLPLTLAVLDGMIVKCGTEKYIIPLTAVIESIYPVQEELKVLVNGGMLASVRGEYIRIVNLHRIFNVKNAITDPTQALVVIVETERYGNVGIMVDELLGQQQVVIKSLEENYDPIRGISAATIMGDGKVALILDVDGLSEMEHVNEKQKKVSSNKQHALLSGER